MEEQIVHFFLQENSSEVFLLLKVCMGTMVSQLLRHHGLNLSHSALAPAITSNA
jgi:hypothetical protein